MIRVVLSIIILSNIMIGCAEIEPPGPERILAPWSGVPAVRLGESKDSVRDKWGEPDEIRQLGADDTGLIKEEWVYRGRYPTVPIDYKYLSKTKRLIFTGNSLTGYETGEETRSPRETPKKAKEQ